MFTVETRKSRYEDIILTDKKSNIQVVITPEKGGMITSIIKNERQYIYIDEENYNSDNRPSCAVPVLFPTLGRTKDETLIIENKKYHMVIHGVVNNRKWNVIEKSIENGASVVISVKSDEESKKSYPFEFEIQLRYTLKGECISIEQEYINHDNKIMPCSFGFHPYFCISHLDNISFDIVSENLFDAEEEIIKPFVKEIDKKAVCGIGEVFAGVKNETSFKDTIDNIDIKLKFDDNFKYVVIWTNKKDKFICVEPWSSIPNCLNTGIDVTKINPNTSLKAKYSIEI